MREQVNSFYLIPATCPTVDKIGDNLECAIAEMIYLIAPEQYHPIIEEFHDAFTESIDKLVSAAIDDIKTSATYPFREALDSLVSEFSSLEDENNQTISELETNLAWERSVVEDLSLQIERLEEQLEKEGRK